MKQPMSPLAAGERALLVQAIVGRQDREAAADSLYELECLADTAGVKVAGAMTQRRDRASASFLVGEGKLTEIQLACRKGGANLVIFDNDLSPVQVNNLDMALGIKVIDRTELILQIFARRAQTAESKIQVELAQLQYLISRLPVSEKQERFRGGIGMRGPGESPLRLRNEPMRKRIRELKRKLEHIGERRRMARENRRWPMVCIVGYTNAGKSTLLNAMSPADAYADDRLFATLDTKTRMVYIGEGRRILLTDTVGFIRHLPHSLVASFRSTLEVAAEADLLLVVADSGHPKMDDHLRVVEETLSEIGAGNVPRLLVLNKWDRLQTPEEQERRRALHPWGVAVSALKKEGLGPLKTEIANALAGCHAYRKS